MPRGGKRSGSGRRPIHSSSAKDTQFSTRLTAETRLALQTSADERSKTIGRYVSLSDEIERRLKRSLKADDVVTQWGGPEHYAIARLVNELSRQIPRAAWNKDRETIIILRVAVEELFKLFERYLFAEFPHDPSIYLAEFNAWTRTLSKQLDRKRKKLTDGLDMDALTYSGKVAAQVIWHAFVRVDVADADNLQGKFSDMYADMFHVLPQVREMLKIPKAVSGDAPPTAAQPTRARGSSRARRPTE